MKEQPFDKETSNIIVSAELNISKDLKLQYLQALKEKFIAQKKVYAVLDRIDMSNIVINNSKAYPHLSTNKFIDTLFYSTIKDATSLYFFLCSDLIYTLRLLSNQKQTSAYKEFWFKIEDYIVREFQTITLSKMVDYIEIFAKMGGSQVFWQEIENYLIKNNAKFKQLEPLLTYRVIVNMGKVGRSHETFWKFFSQLFEHFYTLYNFEQKVYIVDAFAKVNPKMTVQIYQIFSRENLPKPGSGLQGFTLKDDIHLVLALANIIDKYGSARHTQKELFDIIQSYVIVKLHKTQLLDDKELLLNCIQAVSQNVHEKLMRELIQKTEALMNQIEDRQEKQSWQKRFEPIIKDFNNTQQH